MEKARLKWIHWNRWRPDGYFWRLHSNHYVLAIQCRQDRLRGGGWRRANRHRAGIGHANYVGMTPSEYYVALVRLLAEFDQHAAAAEDAAYSPILTTEQREAAVALWKFRRHAIEQVEGMLNAARSSCER
jgi:hypothetical protein